MLKESNDNNLSSSNAELHELDRGAMHENKQIDDGENVDQSSVSIEMDYKEDAENEAETEYIYAFVEKTRQLLIFGLFLERFLEMVVVFAVTILTINWKPLRRLVEDNFWPLDLFVVITAVISTACPRMGCLTRIPGCLLYKLYNFLFQLALYLLLSIHISALVSTKLSPYFAVLAAGIAGSTYLLLSVLSIAKKVNAEGASLYKCALLMPLCALISSQPLYFLAFHHIPYKVFMLNCIAGILVAFIFTFEQVYWTQQYVNSPESENSAVNAAIISAQKSGFLAEFMQDQPYTEDAETEKKRDVGNI